VQGGGSLLSWSVVSDVEDGREPEVEVVERAFVRGAVLLPGPAVGLCVSVANLMQTSLCVQMPRLRKRACLSG
jgi:hypothetical protein